MAKSFFGGGATNNTVNFNLTRYSTIGGFYYPNSTTEANTQTIFRTAGTISKLYCTARWNNLDSGTSTFKLRKNGGNGNGSVSMTNGATGVYQDTTNSDSVAAGDLINGMLTTTGTSGSITLNVVAALFVPTTATDTLTKLVASNSTPYPRSAAGAVFLGPNGLIDSNGTENNVKFEVNIAGTWKNLFVHVPSNSWNATTTVRSRVNNAYGNLTVSITTTSTGTFEDTSNSDTIAVGDDIAIELNPAAGSGTINFDVISTEFINTSNQFFFESGVPYGQSTSFGVSSTTYSNFFGGITLWSDSWAKSDMLSPIIVSNFLALVSANTLNSGNCTIQLRKNFGNVTQNLSIPFGTTGLFKDSSNTDSYVTLDDHNLYITANGTSGSIAFTSIGASALVTLEPNVSDSTSLTENFLRILESFLNMAESGPVMGWAQGVKIYTP